MGKRKGCGVMGVHFSSRLSETHPVKHPSIIPACECIKVMRNYPSNTLKGSAPLCQPPCKEPLQAGEMAWRWMEAQRSPRGPSQARLPPLGPVCLVTPTTGGSVPHSVPQFPRLEPPSCCPRVRAVPPIASLPRKGSSGERGAWLGGQVPQTPSPPAAPTARVRHPGWPRGHQKGGSRVGKTPWLCCGGAVDWSQGGCCAGCAQEGE